MCLQRDNFGVSRRDGSLSNLQRCPFRSLTAHVRQLDFELQSLALAGEEEVLFITLEVDGGSGFITKNYPLREGMEISVDGVNSLRLSYGQASPGTHLPLAATAGGKR